MPSPIWNTSLARRVRHLERTIQPDQKSQWRAYLERTFADPEYDEHRAALIEALLTDSPQYTFKSADYGYVVSWWRRERLAPVVIRLLPALYDAI